MFEGGLEEIILSLLAIVIIMIFLGCFYAFFYAIFLFIFSSGDSDKIKKAWNSIRYMILGIVLTIIILFLFPIVLSRAHFVGYETFNAQSIFNQATKVARAVLNFGKDSSNSNVRPSQLYPTIPTNEAAQPTQNPDDYNNLEL